MLDVHGRVHARRKEHGDEADPLPPIAQDILNESWVLCFDEFQVTDIADAMVMTHNDETLPPTGIWLTRGP